MSLPSGTKALGPVEIAPVNVGDITSENDSADVKPVADVSPEDLEAGVSYMQAAQAVWGKTGWRLMILGSVEPAFLSTENGVS